LKTIFGGLLEWCKDAPHIYQTRKRLINGAKQKPRFLLCELKKPGTDFFSILLGAIRFHPRELAVISQARRRSGRNTALISGGCPQ
jgi:hypothetical protein